MIQTVLTFIIIGLAVGYIIYRLIRNQKNKKKKSSGCEGCSGCDLKDMVEKCPDIKNKSKKRNR